MSEPASTPQSALRRLRILDAVLLFVVAFYVSNAELVLSGSSPKDPPSHTYIVIVSAMAASAALNAWFLRVKQVRPLQESMRLYPNDPTIVKRWFRYVLIVLVVSESIGLFGFILRILGAPFV